MAIEVSIDRSRCIGSGNCVFFLPEVFALDDSDVAYVTSVDAAPESKVAEIARGCPTQAIRVSSVVR